MRHGKPLRDKVFSPEAHGFDGNIRLMDQAIFQSDEDGFVHLPVKNESDHYIGLSPPPLCGAEWEWLG